jgi:hypothetical protein
MSRSEAEGDEQSTYTQTGGFFDLYLPNTLLTWRATLTKIALPAPT